jgi:hypothetical protein
MWVRQELLVYFLKWTHSSEICITAVLQHDQDPIDSYVCQSANQDFCFCLTYLVQERTDEPNDRNQKIWFTAAERTMHQHNVRVNVLVVGLGCRRVLRLFLLRLFQCVLYPQYVVFFIAILAFHRLWVIFGCRKPFSDLVEHKLLIWV